MATSKITGNNKGIGTGRAGLLQAGRFRPSSAALRTFAIPFILCFMLLVASPFFLPKKTMRMVDAVKFLLLAHAAFTFLYNKGPLPKLGLMGWMLIIGLPMDFLSGTSVVKLSPITLVKLMMPGTYQGWDSLQNVGVVLLVAIYITSYTRLTAFVRVLIIAVTVTVALAGLYQYQTGQVFADFSKIEQFRILTSAQVGRLSGLIFGCANEACTPMLIAVGLLFARILDRITLLDMLLISMNLLAIGLTFTRSAWLGVGFIFIGGILLRYRQDNKRQLRFLIIICFLLVCVFYLTFRFGLPNLYESGDIRRLESDENMYARLFFFVETLKLIPDYWLLGNGLTADLQVWHPFRLKYMTPHFFLFDWMIQFGCVATVFFSVLIGVQIWKLIKLNMRKSLHEPCTDPLGLGLLLSYCGVLVNCGMTADRYYFIPLLYSLCATYLRQENVVVFSDERTSKRG